MIHIVVYSFFHPMQYTSPSLLYALSMKFERLLEELFDFWGGVGGEEGEGGGGGREGAGGGDLLLIGELRRCSSSVIGGRLPTIRSIAPTPSPSHHHHQLTHHHHIKTETIALIHRNYSMINIKTARKPKHLNQHHCHSTQTIWAVFLLLDRGLMFHFGLIFGLLTPRRNTEV